MSTKATNLQLVLGKKLVRIFVTTFVLVQLVAAPVIAQTSDPNNSTLFPALNNPLFSTDTLFNQQPTSQNQIQPNAATGTLRLTAHLTDTSAALESGTTWRVFTADINSGSSRLVATSTKAEPQLSLPAGTFAVNVTFGLAHLTQTVSLKPGDNRAKKFVINAGALKVLSKINSSSFISPGSVRFDLMSDERDQLGNRKAVLTNVRPGKITRLNSGVYQIVSRAGDANAVVSSEVTVEAGKLTEATVIHETAKVTLKLVRSRGGDAMADTRWTIKNKEGKTIKETAGALPSHILAPGQYTVTAISAGTAHTRAFQINTGDNVEVEIVMN